MKYDLLKLLMIISRQALFAIIIQCAGYNLLLAGASNGQNVNDVYISLEFKEVGLLKVFRVIKAKTDFDFAFKEDVRGVKIKLDLPYQQISVGGLLKKIANEAGLEFRQINNTINVKAKEVHELKLKNRTFKITDYDRTISGKVTDENDEPLPGASILVKGTNFGTVTDIEGNYVLQVSDEATTLVFSYVGYISEEVTIGSGAILDMVLHPNITNLQDVVVIGYGTATQKELTSSITSVDSKQIENLPVVSFDQALQGQIPGVQITNSSGTPGAAVTVRIRGQRSIVAGNEPLYVVDGVPLLQSNITPSSGNTPGVLLNREGRNTLAGLNPDDIASIEVLKDAAATAIYGSRAANGVVLITTKKGSSGKTKYNLHVFRGWATETDRIDLLNTEEFLELRRDSYRNDNLPIPEALANADSTTNTDWLDQVLRTATISEYQFNTSGGNDKTKFYVSTSYRDEEGILIANRLRRGTARVNLSHTPSEKAGFGMNLAASRISDDFITPNNLIYSTLQQAFYMPPNVAVRHENGNLTTSPVFYDNPLIAPNHSRVKNRTDKIIANAFVNLYLLPWLTFRSNFSYDLNYLREDHFYTPLTRQGFPDGIGFYSTRDIGTYTIEPTLEFNKTVGEDHSLQGLLGLTYLGRTEFSSAQSGTGFPSDNLTYLSSAAVPANVSSNKTGYSFNSFFGRISYDYQQKYLASFTLRRDGSSRFGPSNRHGTFWAASAGWNFTEEAFLQDNPILSFGKLRASYGITGNDQIGDFDYISAWEANAPYLNRTGTSQTRIANDDLKWEETETYNLGLELSFLQNRISLVTDLFLSKTKDLLFTRPVQATSGFISLVDNIGDVENKGLELSVQTTNIDRTFKWNTQFNLSFIRNEVVRLLDERPVFETYMSYLIPGQPLNTFYGFNFLGVDPETGNALYQDVNRDGRITTSGEDFTIIGNNQPDYFGGLTNTFSYKGLQLDVFVQFVQGHQNYNVNLWGTTTLVDFGLNQDAILLQRWRRPGDVTDVPRVTTAVGAGLNNVQSSRYIFDASYVRVKNITLSYQLPEFWANRMKLSSAKIYVTGQNLITFTDYYGFDPEVNAFTTGSEQRRNTAQGIDVGAIPQTKIILIGFKLGI
ncbi:MAG: SusC/RagA family TonB-linked outer membrane protein [Cytophagales bacterium]|nr:SusC/RagA family TonB-linked outer membrane protein [Cytophagales bacterium]